jgi:paraquat-inducible protein A
LAHPPLSPRLDHASTLACDRCGTLQRVAGEASLTSCLRCHSEIERRTGRRLDTALAFASTTFLLLAPANLLPFLSTAALGQTQTSLLVSSAIELAREGWPALAVVIGLVLIVLPPLRFGLLTVVLALLHTPWRPAWLGGAFRIANALQPWAMVDVGLLGLWVAYARLHATVPTHLGAGGVCFVAAGVSALLARACLNRRDVWRRLEADAPAPASGLSLSCEACGQLHPIAAQGGRCSRCGARTSGRRPQAASRAAGLALAGLLLYLPANLYAMATIPIGFEPTGYTVLEGVKDLAEAHLYALALLVFCASFAIPFLKLTALGWFVLSVLRGSARRLLAKTHLYVVVEEIGRWSMVDPLVIACFVPVMQFNTKLYGQAGPAAMAFTAVVVLTMLATQVFDPRRLWDAAEVRA